MYLRTLQVNRLKLLRDVKLDFTDVDGKSIRKWTVIIGKNGTGKHPFSKLRRSPLRVASR